MAPNIGSLWDILSTKMGLQMHSLQENFCITFGNPDLGLFWT